MCLAEPRIVVTGATGAVGGQTLRILSGLGVAATGIGRNAERIEQAEDRLRYRIADYGDPDSLLRAFRGADQLIFVASDGKAESVAQHHTNVINAAVRAGMKRIVFTSIVDVGKSSPFYFAPVYRDSEQWIRATGLSATILRCGIYSDFILRSWCWPAARSGRLALPTASGRLAPISRNDVALALAHAALNPLARPVCQLTGPVAMTMDDVAAIFTDVTAQRLRYTPCSMEAYQRAIAELDAPWPQAYSSLCASIAAANFGHTSEDFMQLVSASPESFAATLSRLHREEAGHET